jgi:hypothetical protein
MKFTLRARLFCLASIFLSGAIVLSAQTLFPGNDFQGTIYGESANGNVTSQPGQNVISFTITNTTSSNTGVHAPGFPTPTPNPSPSPSPSGSPSPSPSASPSSSPSPPFNDSIKKKKSAFKPALVKLRDETITKTVSHDPKKIIHTDRLTHNRGGGGAELAYFITRYIGVLVDGAVLAGSPEQAVLTADLVIRYPFEFGAKTETSGYSKDGKDGKSTVTTGPTWGLAPYIVGGGGVQWGDGASGIGDVGGGVLFRFKEHYGIFVECRWIIHDNRQNYVATTAGLSYNF